MAEPFDIQRFPSGLLELLGMRGSGSTPKQLGAEIRGIVDCAFLYASDNETLAFASNANFAQGGSLTIPITEHVMLTSLSVRIAQNFATTTFMEAQLAVRTRTVLNTVTSRAWVAQAAGTLGGVGAAVELAFVPPWQPYVISPGGGLNVQLGSLVGSADVSVVLIGAICPLGG